jgi:hypothetical protein
MGVELMLKKMKEGKPTDSNEPQKSGKALDEEYKKHFGREDWFERQKKRRLMGCSDKCSPFCEGWTRSPKADERKYL